MKISETPNSAENEEVERGLPQRPSLPGFRYGHLSLGLSGFFVPVDEMHDQSDNHTERNGPDNPCNSQFQAQNPCREDDGQYVDRRTGVEEGDGWTKTRTTPVNAGE